MKRPNTNSTPPERPSTPTGILERIILTRIESALRREPARAAGVRALVERELEALARPR